MHETLKLIALALSIVMILSAIVLLWERISTGNPYPASGTLFIAVLCAIIFLIHAATGEKINAAIWLFDTFVWTIIFASS